MAIFKFKLGNKLRDKVSGHEGIAIGVIEYLNGCIQYGIKGKLDKDKKVPDAVWIDQQQLELIKGGIEVEKSHTGGENMEHP